MRAVGGARGKQKHEENNEVLVFKKVSSKSWAIASSLFVPTLRAASRNGNKVTPSIRNGRESNQKGPRWDKRPEKELTGGHVEADLARYRLLERVFDGPAGEIQDVQRAGEVGSRFLHRVLRAKQAGEPS